MLIRLVVRLEPWLSFVAISAQADVLVNVSNVVMDHFWDRLCLIMVHVR